jgi:Asp-tRNA(Asn)/Glu-tRNA(Gln) amidotransferase A subunit family amidase
MDDAPTAAEAAAEIRAGQLSPVALAEACLARIDALDEKVRAWVGVDRAGALAAAREREAEARAGRFRGPLHGVPVGVKDIFHVAGMVTTAGAGAFAHDRPTEDASAVARLRQAGAIVLGKTVTTEFAYLDPAETRNPWNLEHTPGGSSSGSAAAVAARMVPLALGSQTIGSTLRPAGYCGVVGFKAAYGRISARGTVPLAPSFDHVGILCRTVADAGLAFAVLAAGPRPSMGDGLPGRLRLGLARRLLVGAGPEMTAHLEAVAGALARAGATVEEIELPESLEGLVDAGVRVMGLEAAAVHARRFADHADRYGERIRGLVEAGLKVSGVEYVAAQRHCAHFRQDMADVLDGVDALLGPVSATPAPHGLESTGDPTFCAPATFAGLPAIALPSGVAAGGLPLAVQLVAADDARLLAGARWCEAVLGFSAAPPAAAVGMG